MAPKPHHPFTPQSFLAKIGDGRTVLASRKKQTIFSQGDAADAVFYIQTGKVKLTVVSKQGKEAVVAMLEAGAFFGESCLIGQVVRLATATALEASSILRITKETMLRMLSEEPSFSKFFTTYLLSHSMRIEEDLVDQLFNSSEKTIGSCPSVTCAVWKRGRTSSLYSKHQPGNPCRDDRYDAFPSEFLYEQVPETRLYRIQRHVERPQFPSQHRPSRLSRRIRRGTPPKTKSVVRLH